MFPPFLVPSGGILVRRMGGRPVRSGQAPVSTCSGCYAIPQRGCNTRCQLNRLPKLGLCHVGMSGRRSHSTLHRVAAHTRCRAGGPPRASNALAAGSRKLCAAPMEILRLPLQWLLPQAPGAGCMRPALACPRLAPAAAHVPRVDLICCLNAKLASISCPYQGAGRGEGGGSGGCGGDVARCCRCAWESVSFPHTVASRLVTRCREYGL